MTGDQALQALQPDCATCLTLVASQPVGRLVVPAAEPIVVPVNFVLIRDSIAFRAGASSDAARAVGRRVAFQVHQDSGVERLGWSVIARGTLENASDAVIRQLGLGESISLPADGPDIRWFVFRVRTVTGHWVRAATRSSIAERLDGADGASLASG